MRRGAGIAESDAKDIALQTLREARSGSCDAKRLVRASLLAPLWLAPRENVPRLSHQPESCPAPAPPTYQLDCVEENGPGASDHGLFSPGLRSGVPDTPRIG